MIVDVADPSQARISRAGAILLTMRPQPSAIIPGRKALVVRRGLHL